MEQTTQQETQKPVFPIKTKIAAWWMIVFGGIFLLGFLWVVSLWLFYLFKISPQTEFLLLPPNIPPTGFYLLWVKVTLPGIFTIFLPGIFLLLKRRWTWKFAIVMLIISISYSFSFLYYFIISFPPFILLLLDRKNLLESAN
jgi:hypothetical protein